MTETHDLRNQWYDEPVQYENPMTEKEQIQNQIQELQEKLQKLEEIEKQPRMNLQQEGEYAVVLYHDEVYYRLGNKTTFSWWRKEKNRDMARPWVLIMISDAETERLLEGLYYNHIQVKKEKEQRTKKPVEEAYKDWLGQYPELETDSQYDVTRWHGFQAGYEFAYAEKVMEKVQEEPEELKTLYQMLDDKKHDPDTCVFICDIVQEWMSQYDCDYVTCKEYLEGYDECLTVLDENLK